MIGPATGLQPLRQQQLELAVVVGSGLGHLRHTFSRVVRVVTAGRVPVRPEQDVRADERAGNGDRVRAGEG